VKVAGASVSPFVLGVFAFLLGIGLIAAAQRKRRQRARYPDTYAASGGVVYTIVQTGCGAVLLIGGIGLMVLVLIFKR
jgi:hypothetical protein